jgi:hypothetical protein
MKRASYLPSNTSSVVSKRRTGFPTKVLVSFLILVVLSIANIQGSIGIAKILGDTSCTEQTAETFLLPYKELITAGSSTIAANDLPEAELKARKFWTLFSRSNFHLDLGVPVMGQEEKLLEFARVYGDAIREFNSKVNKPPDQPIKFRLLVTRYPSDDSSRKFRQTLATVASLEEETVIFLPTVETSFHRAHAINLLHAGTNDGEKAAIAIADVDMWVGPRFLFNALKKVNRKAVYFPIVYSEFRPSTFLLVQKFLGPQSKYSEHRGLWRGEE